MNFTHIAERLDYIGQEEGGCFEVVKTPDGPGLYIRVPGYGYKAGNLTDLQPEMLWLLRAKLINLISEWAATITICYDPTFPYSYTVSVNEDDPNYITDQSAPNEIEALVEFHLAYLHSLKKPAQEHTQCPLTK